VPEIESVSITENEKGGLDILDIETYEGPCGKFELYRLLEEGMEAKKSGNTRPFREAVDDIRKGLSG